MHEVDAEVQKIVQQNDIHVYLNTDLRKQGTAIVTNIVNQRILHVPISHSQAELDELNQDGFIIYKNYLNQDEIKSIRNYLDDKPGYNAHIAKYSDKQLRMWNDAYDYSTFSYEPQVLLQNTIILNKLIDPHIVSLAQSYLGCYPTMYSVNCWWHKLREETYITQNNHRDHDDFKFLAFFIYLTDVHESNGPHVYYSGTKSGEESGHENTIIGPAGTAILADTFAIHRGQPLQQGSRLLIWWRYGLSLNNMYFFDENNNFKVPPETLFSKIPKTPHHEYLFRGFV